MKQPNGNARNWPQSLTAIASSVTEVEQPSVSRACRPGSTRACDISDIRFITRRSKSYSAQTAALQADRVLQLFLQPTPFSRLKRCVPITISRQRQWRQNGPAAPAPLVSSCGPARLRPRPRKDLPDRHQMTVADLDMCGGTGDRRPDRPRRPQPELPAQLRDVRLARPDAGLAAVH